MATMHQRLLLIFILSIIVLLVPVFEVHSDGPLDNDDETIALQQLHTIFGSAIDPDPLQDATMTVMDIRRNWEKWSPGFREAAEGYFVKKHLSPVEGHLRKTASLSAGKAANGGHLLPNWVETAHFSIEWGNHLENSDGGRDSVRIINCSQRLTGLSCAGIPDIVDNWADYFEEVWEKEIDTLGYIEPTGTQSYLYDIYIANTGDPITGNDDDETPSLGTNYLGITTTYSSASDSSSYIIVNGYVRNAHTMMITAAHEFFHAIQFSYPSDWFSHENRWWIESTATWMEEIVYDDVNSYYTRVRSWLRNPSLSLKYSGNNYSDHEYGDVLFIIFLTDVYLKDKEFVKYVWESAESGINTINNVLVDKYNSDFDSAFREFVALNAVADIGELKGGYEEGPQYGRASVTRIHDKYPVPYSEISGENAPQELGSNYIHLIPPDAYDNKLIIEFDGSDNINSAAMVVKVKSDGSGFEKEVISLFSPQNYGCHAIEGFGSTYSEVFLVAAVLVDHTLVETAPYHYKASINGACTNTDNASAYLSQSDNQTDVIDKENSRRCFIATAAFGSPESTSVRILRDFRDKYLLPYRTGQRFVDLYYTVSPPMAEFIEDHPPASFIVRIALLPAVAIAFLFPTTTLWWNITLIIIVLVTWLIPYRYHG